MNGRLESMGEDAFPVYGELYQDVCHLHSYWKVFIKLFGDDEAVSLLNATAEYAASAIQLALVESVVLRITKLTDPAKQKRYENLSLEQLWKRLESEDLRERLRPVLDEIQKRVEPMRTRRNKRLAHRDLDHALDPEKVLPGLSKSGIEEVLVLIRNFMNELEEHYGSVRNPYDLIEPAGDGEELLRHIAFGQRFFELLKRMDRGKLTAEDIVSRLRQGPLPSA